MLTLRTTGICTAVHGKTTNPVFKDLKVGDRIEFSCPIIGNPNDIVAPSTHVRCVNVQTKTIGKLSFHQLSEILQKFEITDRSDIR